MKNLSLLCTLHADGPATTAVLRRDGCEGLAALLEYEVRDLARLLEWDDARAERFLREGLELSERLEEGLFESEEAGLEPEFVEVPAGDEDDEEWGEDDSAEGSVQEVLEHWRDLDIEDPPAPADEDFVVPRPEPEVGTALSALAVCGLEPVLLRRLAEADVESAEELLETTPLALATALGLGLTRVLRLQFLVRRALVGSPEPAGVEAETR